MRPETMEHWELLALNRCLSPWIWLTCTQIVDKVSATLSLAGHREDQVAVDADHSSICKFASLQEKDCRLVLKTIAVGIEEALKLDGM